MSTSEKTYTFRASKDLVPRAREALSTLRSLIEEETDEAGVDEAMSTFLINVHRRARELPKGENQSALFRTTLEAFVDAAEKLARDREYLAEYEAWGAEDDEGRSVRAGALAAAADRWRD